ncbi:MAG: peptidoglycan-binding protein [Oscillospiraceae bacterium]
MSLSVTDQPNNIIQVQNFLRGVALSNKKIPSVIPDGIYGAETQNAVKIFQEEYGLPITGEVDEATWNELEAQYKIATRKFRRTMEILPFPKKENFAVKYGELGYLVYIIQVMLNEIATEFGNLTSIPVTGNYDKETETAVKKMQKIFVIDISGIVDENTWKHLAKSFNATINFR